MRKHTITVRVALMGGFFVGFGALAQEGPTVTPSPTQPAGPSTDVAQPIPAGTPLGTYSSPTPAPSPQATPAPAITPPPGRSVEEPSAVTSSNTFEWSERGAPVFTLDKAVITALHQNPDLLRALQEIERTKGVIIQVRAQALPRVTASADLSWTDPRLNRSGISTTTTGTPAPTPV